MPARPPGLPPGLLLVLGATGLVGLSAATGWWLGQRQQPVGSASRRALEAQVEPLRQRVNRGEADGAEQQRLVELLLTLGQQAEATQRLESLADRQPERWQLRLLLAELRRQGHDRIGAARELRQILNLQPDHIEALQLMTLVQLEQGQGAQAQAQLEALFRKLSQPPVKPQALPIGLLLGDLLQRRQAPGQAEALYLKLASDFSRDPRPLLALALLKQQQGDSQAAKAALGLARQRQPNQVDPRLDQIAASWGLNGLKGPSRPRQAPERPLPAAGPTP